MARIIVGTAGHIDHGKSSLVRALTGIDPDRLPEEKRRGITIDLGFAFLDEIAAIIDVPGHERFIKNMVAGAATIDFAILVVAADDGVMPQTHEHLQILRLLGLTQGCIVITKIDLSDPEWIELVEDQIRKATRTTFLENAPCYRVDSISGIGLTEFRAKLIATLQSLTPRTGRGVFRLPIDRVFTVKGRGTVVTGTVLSGTIEPESEICAYPLDIRLRVKHVESHGTSQKQIEPGQRAALNLQGDTDKVTRGQTIGPVHGLHSTTRIAVKIETLPQVEELKDRQRIRFLIGTEEALGRLQILDRDVGLVWANVLLEEPIVAAWSDRFILRRYSPLETLGGGMVLDPSPPPLRAKNIETEVANLKRLQHSEIDLALKSYVSIRDQESLTTQSLAAYFAATSKQIDSLLTASSDFVLLAGHWFSTVRVEELEAIVIGNLRASFEKNAGQIGFSPHSLKDKSFNMLTDSTFDSLINRLVESGRLTREGGLLRFPQRNVAITAQQEKIISAIAVRLKSSAFAPPSADILSQELHVSKSEVAKLLVIMERLGRCKRLGLDLFFDSESFDHAIVSIVKNLSAKGQLGVADVSAILNSSRKFVVPLLEQLDEKGITRRDGNFRYPGRNFDSLQSSESA